MEQNVSKFPQCNRIFTFGDKQIRVTKVSNQPFFVAKDLCQALGLTNSRMVLKSLDDDEKGVSTIYTLGGMQKINVVNESGLYHLIFLSRKPEAKAFRKWVTSQVLPQIRKEVKSENVINLFENGYGEDMAKSLIAAVRAINFLALENCDLFTSREAQAVDDLLYLFAAIVKDLYKLDIDMKL